MEFLAYAYSYMLMMLDSVELGLLLALDDSEDSLHIKIDWGHGRYRAGLKEGSHCLIRTALFPIVATSGRASMSFLEMLVYFELA